MTHKDNVEAFFLFYFLEGVQKKRNCPQSNGQKCHQNACYDLTLQGAKDYSNLKAEFLARLGVTLAVRAQRVQH